MNVLSVSPNFLTADELAQLALAATNHGSILKGVVVVNPDPDDTTSGRWRDEVVRPLSPESLGGAAAEDPVALDAPDGNGAPRRTLDQGSEGLMAVAPLEEDATLGPVIRPRTLWAAIRRRWRTSSSAAVGLLVGAGLHLVIPRKYSATSDLYLAIPSGSNPSEVMANNVALLQTDAVAKQAIAAGRSEYEPALAARPHFRTRRLVTTSCRSRSAHPPRRRQLRVPGPSTMHF